LNDQQIQQLTRQALEQGEGVVRLAPTWVPRVFCVPGRRLRLDTRDLYAYGAHRGGIDERWLASTVKAENGPLTASAAASGVTITNNSATEPLVVLKHVKCSPAVIGRELLQRLLPVGVFHALKC
jgi:hypothetical protein